MTCQATDHRDGRQSGADQPMTFGQLASGGRIRGDHPRMPTGCLTWADVIFGRRRVRDHDALLIITAAYSGLRWGELAGLQWIRTYLPMFLTTLLTEHRQRHPKARFVFTDPDGGLHRRSNFRRRVWLPALAGDPEQGWAPINPALHFHDLAHAQDLAHRGQRAQYGGWTWSDNGPLGREAA